MMDVALATQHLIVGFGADTTAVTGRDDGWELSLPIPVAGGSPVGSVLFRGESRRIEGGFHLVESEGMVAGCMVASHLPPRLERPVYHAYRELFQILGGRALYRVWNYVPRINAVTDGLENYQAFNVGRHRALVERFGSDFTARVPAASALGIGDEDCFALAFIAGDRQPRYIENPEQVPAYQYPRAYGPESPAFARGTVVDIAGRRTGFLSGTSSVKGYLTEASGDLGEQFRVTLDNIRIVATKMGFADALDPSPTCSGDYRFFFRHASDATRAKALFGSLPGADSRDVIYLHSDICRSDLSLEIEAVLRAMPR